MATMHPIDNHLYIGLSKMQRAMDGLLQVRSTAIDDYNAKKTLLDQQWQTELEPIMHDLYWWPFRNGVNDAPTEQTKLRPWLKDKFRDAAVIALLLALLRRYHIRAYNLGGQSALAFLELSGTFNLTDATYLQQLSDRSDMLTEQDTDESLIDTTINDLTVAVPQARDNEIGMLLALAAYIDNRAKQRTVLIERYERPWAVGEALNHTYQNNGIRYKMYDKNILACKEICEPWHGRVVEISGEYSTIIPQHPGCDCLWQPIRQNGQRLGNPPVVVNVPGLEPWQAPATPWTGGSR